MLAEKQELKKKLGEEEEAKEGERATDSGSAPARQSEKNHE